MSASAASLSAATGVAEPASLRRQSAIVVGTSPPRSDHTSAVSLPACHDASSLSAQPDPAPVRGRTRSLVRVTSARVAEMPICALSAASAAVIRSRHSVRLVEPPGPLIANDFLVSTRSEPVSAEDEPAGRTTSSRSVAAGRGGCWQSAEVIRSSARRSRNHRRADDLSVPRCSKLPCRRLRARNDRRRAEAATREGIASR